MQQKGRIIIMLTPRRRHDGSSTAQKVCATPIVLSPVVPLMTATDTFLRHLSSWIELPQR